MIRSGIKVKRVNIDGSTIILKDSIAVDSPVCIFVDDLPYRTLIASLGKQRELTLGHLFSEGVIGGLHDISGESYKEGRSDISLKTPVDLTEIHFQRERVITTACNTDQIDLDVLGNYSVERKNVNEAVIFDLVKTLNEKAKSFRSTGGTHSAIISSLTEGLTVTAEDVGRHNAVDKVIGSGLIEGLSLNDCMLASSGRLSGDLVLKAARAGIPVMCSISAPLQSGLNVAEKTGVSLYGFVRGRRLNQYLTDHTS